MGVGSLQTNYTRVVLNMDKNEELEIVTEALKRAYDLKIELEILLESIQNPNIHTKEGKKNTVRRLRLVNNVIYTGEKAKLSLETEITRENNPKMRLKKRNNNVR